MPKYPQYKEMSITPVQEVKEGFSLRYPMLSATNYSTWAIKMEANMDARGIWSAIEPAIGEVMERQKDKLARACLLGAVPEDVLQQIAKKKTAKEMWESLKTRCLGVDRVKKARVQTLKSDFKDLRMKETESIDEFAGKISSLANKLSDLGATMEDAELVKKLLDSVPSKFLQVIAAIEQFSDLDAMAFDEAIGRLKAYEERIRKHDDASGSDGGTRLLLTEEEWIARKKKNQKRDKKTVKCYHCQELGHFAWECPEKKKEEDAKKGKEEKALLASGYASDEPALL